MKRIKVEFVTAAEAAKVMGVTEVEYQTTSPHFKPGTQVPLPHVTDTNFQKYNLYQASIHQLN